MSEEVLLKQEVTEKEEHLRSLMDREVRLSREILSNLREEEQALLEHDLDALQEVMSERDQPLQELMNVRKERMDSAEELVHLLFQDAPLNQIEAGSVLTLLEDLGVESSEVLLLRDQLIALIEKMNLQNSSNLHLSHLPLAEIEGAAASFFKQQEFTVSLPHLKQALALTLLPPK